ncbi:3'-5' exonuclease [Paraburkholderia sp. RCC_158]|uniref:3'-5' exonuclease n=2 Tax=Paraburkholderia TaxID=1822464 RepID=UPI0035261977
MPEPTPQERLAAMRRLYAVLKRYLDRPAWTPAEGALILSGLCPPTGCTELPRTATGLDDRPYEGDVIDRMIKARDIMRTWDWHCEDYAEKGAVAPNQVEPCDFIQWCVDTDIETDWMRLILDVIHGGEAQTDRPELIPLAVLDYASQAEETLGVIHAALAGRDDRGAALGTPVARPAEKTPRVTAGPMPIPVNRDHVSTEELAAILAVNPQSIRKRYSSDGSYHGIRPRKLPNRRLLWPVFAEGHPDVEGGVQPSKCAVLGRTRFALLSIEAEFKERGIDFVKRLSGNHENESELVEDFLVALRILANPKDRLHLATLTKRWRLPESHVSGDFVANLTTLAASSNDPKCAAVRDAIAAAAKNSARVNLMPALDVLKAYADTLEEAERLPIYEDVAVLSREWDQFLRTATGSKNLAGFISSKALGGTQKASRDGVALLTVHSSKGLEFDVVFMAGMADGVFPDYRATGPKERAEETRNAFVAATRSRRLLYLTYPASRLMPWGDERRQRPSPFLNGVQR